MLNWGLTRGHVVIPRASNPVNQAENINVYGFTLFDEDMEKIEKIESGKRLMKKFFFYEGYDVFA